VTDRITQLQAELDTLRHATGDGADALQSLAVGMAEVKLNLAQQDRLLAKLDASINGNGRAGLLMRMDRAERWIAVNSRLAWTIITAVVALLVHEATKRINNG
jgi:hypothetical protein